MAQVYQCELCEKVDQNGFNMEDERKYCTSCNSIIWEITQTIRKETQERLGGMYDQATCNQAQVVNLCKYFWDDRPREFTESFGTMGYEFLRRALEK
jgi:hypothetical protein